MSGRLKTMERFRWSIWSGHRKECTGRAIGELGQGKDGALSLRTLEASVEALGWVRYDVYELAIE